MTKHVVHGNSKILSRSNFGSRTSGIHVTRGNEKRRTRNVNVLLWQLDFRWLLTHLIIFSASTFQAGNTSQPHTIFKEQEITLHAKRTMRVSLVSMTWSLTLAALLAWNVASAFDQRTSEIESKRSLLRTAGEDGRYASRVLQVCIFCCCILCRMFVCFRNRNPFI